MFCGTVSNSDHTEFNDLMILNNELENIPKVSHGLILGTIPACLEGLKKAMMSWPRFATSHLMITSQKHCCLTPIFSGGILHNHNQPNKTCHHYYPIKFHYKPSGSFSVNIFSCKPTECHPVKKVVTYMHIPEWFGFLLLILLPILATEFLICCCWQCLWSCWQAFIFKYRSCKINRN